MSPLRPIAVTAVLITAAGALYAAVAAVTGWEPSLGWLAQAVIHVGELLAVVALARCGAVGTGRAGLAGRIGLGLAVLGQALMAIAEVVWPRDHGLGDVLFGVAPLLTGVGLIAAGVVVLRAGRLTGLPRVLPLALGLYVFVVLTPVLIGSGGPPAPVAVAAIAGWDVLWALVAASTIPRAAAAGTGPRRVTAELH